MGRVCRMARMMRILPFLLLALAACKSKPENLPEPQRVGRPAAARLVARGRLGHVVDTGEDAADPYAHVKTLRAQIEASGEDYIGFYHLECLSFEEVK